MTDKVSISFDSLMGDNILSSVPNFLSNQLFQDIAGCFRSSETLEDAIQDFGYQKAAESIPMILRDKKLRHIVDEFFVVKWSLAEIELVGGNQASASALALPYPYSSLSSEDLETNSAKRFLRIPLDMNIVVSLDTDSTFILEYARSAVLNPQVIPTSDDVREISLPANHACLWAGPVWTRLKNQQGRALRLQIVPAFINKATNLADRLPLDFLRATDAEFRERLGVGSSYPKRQPQPLANLV